MSLRTRGGWFCLVSYLLLFGLCPVMLPFGIVGYVRELFCDRPMDRQVEAGRVNCCLSSPLAACEFTMPMIRLLAVTFEDSCTTSDRGLEGFGFNLEDLGCHYFFGYGRSLDGLIVMRNALANGIARNALFHSQDCCFKEELVLFVTTAVQSRSCNSYKIIFLGKKKKKNTNYNTKPKYKIHAIKLHLHCPFSQCKLKHV